MWKTCSPKDIGEWLALGGAVGLFLHGFQHNAAPSPSLLPLPLGCISQA